MLSFSSRQPQSFDINVREHMLFRYWHLNAYATEKARSRLRLTGLLHRPVGMSVRLSEDLCFRGSRDDKDLIGARSRIVEDNIVVECIACLVHSRFLTAAVHPCRACNVRFHSTVTCQKVLNIHRLHFSYEIVHFDCASRFSCRLRLDIRLSMVACCSSWMLVALENT